MNQKRAFGVKVMFLLFLGFHLSGQDRTLVYENEFNIRPVSEINAVGFGDAYPWISDDGLRLFYTAQSNDNTKSAIWSANREDIFSPFSTFNKLSFNDDRYDNLSAWISQDELVISYVQRKINKKRLTQIMICERKNKEDLFGTPQKIELTGNIKGTLLSPSFTQDRSELIVYNEYNSSRYLLHFDQIDNNIYKLRGKINIPEKYTIKTGKLSPDGLEYYISLEYKSRKPKIYVLARHELGLFFSTLHPLKNKTLNEKSKRNHQPYFSSNGQFVVFTRSSENDWKHNELFIGQTNIIGENIAEVSIVENEKNSLFDLSIYPNPSSAFVSISNPNQRTLKAVIYNSQGQMIDIIKNENLAHRIDISNYVPGSYIFRIHDVENKQEQVFRILKVD